MQSAPTVSTPQILTWDLIAFTDDEAVQQLRFILERLKVLTEPAASCTLSAALRLKDRFTKDNNVVLILCGGNLSVEDLCKYNSQV